jgi:hypothetical protein
MNGLAALFIISPPMHCGSDCRSCTKQKKCCDTNQKYKCDHTDASITKNKIKKRM